MMRVVAALIFACHASLAVGARFARRSNASAVSAGADLDFLVIGDQGKRDTNQRNVALELSKIAAKVNPVAILGMGDNVYGWKRGGGMDKLVDSFTNIYYKHQSLRVPWWLVSGNHDWAGPGADMQVAFTKSSRNKGKLWNMPDFWFKKTWTSPKGMTAEFFFMESYIWKGIKKKDLQKKAVAWLEKELAASKADWRVVITHHPVLMFRDGAIVGGAMSKLESTLKKYKVPLYMAGHAHSLMVVRRSGTTHIVSGGGCAKKGGARQENKPQGGLRRQSGGGFFHVRFNDMCTGSLTMYGYLGKADYTTTFNNWGCSKSQGLVNATAPAEDSIMTTRDVTKGKCLGKDMDMIQNTCSDGDGCYVQVDGDITCREYCEGNGLSCEGAWDQDPDTNEECRRMGSLGCDEQTMQFGNQLCQCGQKA